MKEGLAAQIAELQAVHDGLTEIEEREHEVAVSGALSFEATHDRLGTITDTFEIKLLVPEGYPDRLPRVRETRAKITGDYDHVYADGRLCLAVPVEERRIFGQQPSLLGFVNGLVVPYLYGYCHWERHGEHPFGEQKHGAKGIVQYYVERLHLKDDMAALAIVAFLFEHGYRGHHACPCRSGQIVRRCHGSALRELHENHTPETLRIDFAAVLEHCIETHGVERLSRASALMKQVNRLLGKWNRQGRPVRLTGSR